MIFTYTSRKSPKSTFLHFDWLALWSLVTTPAPFCSLAVCVEMNLDSCKPWFIYFFTPKIIFPTWNLYTLAQGVLTNRTNCVFKSYFLEQRLFSGRFGVIRSPSGPERETEVRLLETLTRTLALIMLFCQGQAGGGIGKWAEHGGEGKGGALMISHNPVRLRWWMSESTGVLCLWREWRGTLPHCLLPVHRHVHLIHPSLRDSTRWHQQAHACG